MDQNQGKGSFASNFGFLMAATGSAVGLGNIWGFPYKMGMNGGFAFLLIYILMAIFVGYPLVLGEITLGRKTGKAAVQAYATVDKRFVVNGVFETAVPFILLCFYSVLGGIIIKYFVANIGDIFGASWGVGGANSEAYYQSIITDPEMTIIFTLLFIAATAWVVRKGISNGIEIVCKYGIPVLFIMLVITDIRCCTLPGAKAGLDFMFKPDFTVLQGSGWFKVFATAGSQMFFSLSLASGALIVYGSYLDRQENLQKNAALIPLFDTAAALLSGLAVLPALFASGIEPTMGPGVLFVSLQTVFESMGSTGPFFGTLFYALVLIAVFTSTIGMMEGGIAAMMDARIKKGKTPNRHFVFAIITVTTTAGAVLVALDEFGFRAGFYHPFGLTSWLDVFDLAAEGILMPLGGLLMALLLGWVRRGYLDDEVLRGSNFASKTFVNLCMRWLAPIFMLFILFVQFSSFFFSDTVWYQNLMG